MLLLATIFGLNGPSSGQYLQKRNLQMHLHIVQKRKFCGVPFTYINDGLNEFHNSYGLVVSMLASGTRVRGFKPGRRCWIFRVSEKSSACLPSEGKWKNLSHVPALRHVKESCTFVNYDVLAKFLVKFPPSLAEVSRACVVRGASGDEWGELIGGKGTIGLQAAVPKGPTRNL